MKKREGERTKWTLKSKVGKGREMSNHNATFSPPPPSHLGMPAHAEIVVGAPDCDVRVRNAVPRIGKLHRLPVHAREDAIRSLPLLLFQLVLAVLVVVENAVCEGKGGMRRRKREG